MILITYFFQTYSKLLHQYHNSFLIRTSIKYTFQFQSIKLRLQLLFQTDLNLPTFENPRFKSDKIIVYFWIKQTEKEKTINILRFQIQNNKKDQSLYSRSKGKEKWFSRVGEGKEDDLDLQTKELSWWRENHEKQKESRERTRTRRTPEIKFG